MILLYRVVRNPISLLLQDIALFCMVPDDFSQYSHPRNHMERKKEWGVTSKGHTSLPFTFFWLELIDMATVSWNVGYSWIFMYITKNSIIIEEGDKYSLSLSVNFHELHSDLDDHSPYSESKWSWYLLHWSELFCLDIFLFRQSVSWGHGIWHINLYILSLKDSTW